MIEVKYIERTNEEIEKEVFENLIENFNSEAIKQNNKFRLKIKYKYPHLTRGNWLFEDYSCQIVWNNLDNFFSFVDELDEDIFNQIKPILENLKGLFKIEIVK